MTDNEERAALIWDNTSFSSDPQAAIDAIAAALDEAEARGKHER